MRDTTSPQNISDTAQWVAWYRALESERPDAWFRDPLARRLAGVRGDTKRAKLGARVDREKLRQIDLHWHDLRHEGACRFLSDGVDIRTIPVDAWPR